MGRKGPGTKGGSDHLCTMVLSRLMEVEDHSLKGSGRKLKKGDVRLVGGGDPV